MKRPCYTTLPITKVKVSDRRWRCAGDTTGEYADETCGQAHGLRAVHGYLLDAAGRRQYLIIGQYN